MPAAFIVSVVGVFRDARMGYAVAGAVASGAAGVVLIVIPLIQRA
jgi:hypothetical protein